MAYRGQSADVLCPSLSASVVWRQLSYLEILPHRTAGNPKLMANRSHFNGGHIGMNLLRKKGLQHSSAIAVQTTDTPETFHSVAVRDCLATLKQIPDSSIQLVVCDPPYNINVAAWDSVENYIDWAGKWISEVQRVLAPSGNLVIFGGLQYQGEAGSGDLLSLIYW